jgi:hypothetical protein
MPNLHRRNVRQCAWCWLVVDPSGTYSLQPRRKINSATHGICPTCKAELCAEIQAPSDVGALELIAA